MILTLLGALAVTAGILGRFVYRRAVIFDLHGFLRFIIFVLGVGMLLGSIFLNVYGHEEAALQALLTPTP